MHDSFWFGADLGDLMINGLTVKNAGAMVGVCFFFFFLTIIFEWMKVLESKMRKEHNTRIRKEMEGACVGDRSNLLGDNCAVPGPSSRNVPLPSGPPVRNKYVLRLCQVSLYTTNTSVNYIIMLAVMLFNVYIFIAVILGVLLGYGLFGHIKTGYNIESISEKQQVVTVCAPGCEDPDGSTPPLLRGMGTSEVNTSRFTCEARGQKQRLLEHSPTNSSEETDVTNSEEQVEIHDEQISNREIEDKNIDSLCSRKEDIDKNIITTSCCSKDNSGEDKMTKTSCNVSEKS